MPTPREPLTKTIEDLVASTSMGAVLTAVAEVARARAVAMVERDPPESWEYDRVATLVTAVADCANDI